MNVETLESALRKLPSARQCLLGVSGCETVAQLLDTAIALRARLPSLKGQRIALCGLAPAELVLALVAFDGRVQQILLLPYSLDTPTMDELCAKASITYCLSNGLEFRRIAEPDQLLDYQPTTCWILVTSGTTGTPKLVEHNLATLVRTVRRDEERGADYVWGLMYDPSRFAGLQVVLQALLSGSALVLTDSVVFASQLEAMLSYPVNALSATPTLWRKMLMDGRVTKLSLRQLTLGGETADQSIINALKACFPRARLVHIYASTEVGTGFAVKDGRAGFPAEWLDNPSHIPLMRVDGEHHLWIKPPLLPSGKEVASRLSDDGYLDTEDLVCINGDRVLFLGRVSGAINVGGNKVNPETLETFLREIEGVMDARVFAKSSSITGQLVAAEIVAAHNGETQNLRLHIIKTCRNNLELWQVPAFITFVNTIKETAAGKRERVQV